MLFTSAANAELYLSPSKKVMAETSSDALTVSYKTKGGWQKIYTATIAGIEGGSSSKIKVAYDMVTGKQLHINKKGIEAAHTLKSGGTLMIRVFDDGVAFKKLSRQKRNYNGESETVINFSTAINDWVMKWGDGAEGFFPQNGNKKDGSRWSLPALFEYPNNVFALIHEADVRHDMAASSLYSTANRGEYRIVTDQNEKFAESSTWKVVMVGSLADVVESTLVTDVSTPSKIKDPSWIKPGVAAWVYWAYNHGSDDYDIIKKYTDMAVALKLPYVLIDAEWDRMKDGKTVEDAVKYALGKGIKPMIWYNSSVGWVNGAPTPKFRLNKPEDREKEFAWCEKIGVVGVKIDFFSGENNMNMAYCIDLLESAAKHHLLVNFHGATVPRGWMRTYPNLISTEGVYGAEWYNNVGSFTDKAACHNATLPFTRNVVGSMDYTPCAFTDSQHPHITTHAHELALTALFESGIQHLADRPEGFYAQPQEVKDYISQLPTAWDETRLIDGYPGKFAIMARRSGTTWYICGINGTDQEMQMKFNTKRLKGLGKQVTMFEDARGAYDSKVADKPGLISLEEQYKLWNITTPKKVPSKIKCKARGGFVIVVK